MIKSQRKSHLLIWILLVVVVSAGVVFSIRAIDQPLAGEVDLDAALFKSGGNTFLDNETFTIQGTSGNTHNSLTLILKKPLENASAIVYGRSAEGGKEHLGTISAKGIYRFRMGNKVSHLQLYDAIKEMEILNLELSWE